MGVIGGVMGVRVCVFVLNGCNRAHVVPFSSKDVARISPIQTSRRICGKKAHGETSRPAISWRRTGVTPPIVPRWQRLAVPKGKLGTIDCLELIVLSPFSSLGRVWVTQGAWKHAYFWVRHACRHFFLVWWVLGQKKVKDCRVRTEKVLSEIKFESKRVFATVFRGTAQIHCDFANVIGPCGQVDSFKWTHLLGDVENNMWFHNSHRQHQTPCSLLYGNLCWLADKHGSTIQP